MAEQGGSAFFFIIVIDKEKTRKCKKYYSRLPSRGYRAIDRLSHLAALPAGRDSLLHPE